MAYTFTFVIELGTYDTGLTLYGQLVDTDGVDVGGKITTGWVELGTGYYILTASIPDDHRGAIQIHDDADDRLIEVGVINPESVKT